MASFYKKESILINIPASEIIKKCRFAVGGTGGDSDVTGYYTDDKPEKYRLIHDFISVPETEWYVDSEKVKEYGRDVIKYVYPYKEKYINNMSSFKQLIVDFGSNDVRIPPMLFGGNTGRYLKFNNSNELSMQFKELLYEGISNLIIEKRIDKFFVYPELKKDFFKKLAIQVSDIPPIYDEDFIGNSEYLKNEFKKWLVTAKKTNGDNYSEKVQSNYIWAVSKASTLLEKDLYSIYRASDLYMSINSFLSNDELMKKDIEEHNRTISSGLKVYKKFFDDFFGTGDLANYNLKNQDLIKFKKLLGWFIKQLNINNGIDEGIKTAGQGYKDGSSIRNLYKEWREYDGFTLDCNMVSGFQSTFSKVNYINRTKTGINIRPKFDTSSKQVKLLYIDVYDTKKEPSNEIAKILEKEYITEGLSLFDGLDPNGLVNELFSDYKKVIAYFSLDIEDSTLPKRLAREIKIHSLNTILYGAPGTGKTYATAEYAVAIIENRDIKDEDRVELMAKYSAYQNEGKIIFTTFHQSYGYEDFIQGLRPENINGMMEFKPVDGVFKRIADRALKDAEGNYVIIIDEINRANMSKVLGELITLIEEDKRWGETNQLSVTLPSGQVFAVPNNLYIVGTMNTADKSISIIDVALRRRFEFIEQRVDLSKVLDTKLRDVLRKINEKLKDETDSTDLLVGHAYFMNKTINDLDKILNRAIIPLLYEYFFDNGKKVKSVVEEAIKETGYKVDSSTLGRIKVVKE